MMINNQYKGQTQILGASMLNVNPIVKIREGCNTYTTPNTYYAQIDSYPYGSWTTSQSTALIANSWEDYYGRYLAQSFYVGQSCLLNSCIFHLIKIGSPTGNVVAKLWGTIGATTAIAQPLLTELATSASVDVSIIPSVGSTYIGFTFSGINAISLSGGSNYAIGLYYEGTSTNNCIRAAMGTTNYHPGIRWINDGMTAAWYGSSALDMVFYLNAGVSVYPPVSCMEFNDLGKFNVTTIQNYGYGTQKVNLTTQREFDMMDFDKRIFPQELKKGFYYYNDFSNPATISDFSFCNSSFWGITAGNLVRGTSINVFEHAMLNLNTGLEDFIATLRVKGSHIATTVNGAMGILFKAQDLTMTTSPAVYPNGEHAWLIKETANTRPNVHTYVNGNYYSSVAGASTAFSNNIYYEIRLVVRGPNIQMSYRIPPNSFTSVLNYVGDIYKYGGVGIGTYGAYEGTFSVDSFEVQELQGHYTRENALKECIAQKDIIANIPDRLVGMSTFEAQPGVSYFMGLTNGYQQLDIRTSAGDSWNMLFTSGATFNDFCAEVEFNGMSQNWAGMAIGNSGLWYGFYNFTTSAECSVEYYSTGRSQLGSKNTFIRTVGGLWSRFKLVKNEGYVSAYLNGELVNSVRTDYLPNNSANVKIGLFSYKGGASGSRVSFRNFRISELDDTMKTTTFDTQSNTKTTFERMLPTGYVARQAGQTVSLYNLDILTGQTINNLESSSVLESLSNIKKYLYVKGDNMGTARVNDDFVPRTDAFNSNFEMVSDTTLDDITTLNWSADSEIDILNSSDNQFSVKSMPYFVVDKYDTINFVDETLGVSKNLVVSNITKHYEAEGGMKQDLTLVDK